MSVTVERIAPPAPDDDELHRIVHGHPNEQDEIVYPHPLGTFSTTRKERARAHAWQQEQTPHPNNAEVNLALTERMIRHRLGAASIGEQAGAIRDLAAFQNFELPKMQLEYQPPKSLNTPETTTSQHFPEAITTDQYDTFDEETSQHPAIQPKQEIVVRPAAHEAQTDEYRPHSHRRRGMRIPLHRLIRHRHKYTPRHARTEL